MDMVKLAAIYFNHCNSQARALYSASVELRETEFYFLDFQEIKHLG